MLNSYEILNLLISIWSDAIFFVEFTTVDRI
jgi:hypothetical protein